MPTGPTTLERLTIAALVVGVLFGVERSWSLGQSVAGIDYYQFWAVGEAVEHEGVRDIYSDHERTRMGALGIERASREAPESRLAVVAPSRPVFETYSTPFLYTAMHWLASGDYETDFTRWHALSLLSFVLGVVGICFALGVGLLPTLAGLAGLLFFFAPLQSETQVANVNNVQLGGLALGLVLLKRANTPVAQIGAAFVFAVVAMFKPNIAVGVLLLLASVSIHRGPRAAIHLALGLAGGIAFAFATSSGFIGSASWLQWLATVQFIPPEIITVEMGNYAPLLFVFGEGAAGGTAILIALLCAPLLFALWQRRGREVESEVFLNQATLLGAGCAVFLLSANLVWEHYFILSVPLLLSTLCRALSSTSRTARERLLDRTLPGIAFLGLMATPTFALSSLPHEVYFPLMQGGGTLILYGLAVRQLLEPREEPVT